MSPVGNVIIDIHSQLSENDYEISCRRYSVYVIIPVNNDFFSVLFRFKYSFRYFIHILDQKRTQQIIFTRIKEFFHFFFRADSSVQKKSCYKLTFSKFSAFKSQIIPIIIFHFPVHGLFTVLLLNFIQYGRYFYSVFYTVIYMNPYFRNKSY